MKLSKLGGSIETGIHTLGHSFIWVAATAVCLMMLLTFSDVIGRYLFNRPIKGAAEITEQMLVFVIFLAAAYLAAKNRHVRVDAVTSRLPSRGRAILDSVTSFACAGTVTLLVWQMGARAWDMILYPGSTTPILLVPLGPFVMVAAIGCLILCLEFWLQFSHALAQAVSK